MIALDTNLLVYAHRADSEWHQPALKVLRELANQSNRWAIPYPCLHEFYSITTHPKIYSPPSTQDQSLHFLDELLKCPSLVLIGEDQQYWKVLRTTLKSSKVVGPMVHDARIAAICSNHGVRELWTSDRDFSRFPSIKIRNPLVSPR